MGDKIEFDDSEKHNLHQYDRMQDLVAAYAQLAIKASLVICGGALVSIGSAFISLTTNKMENLKAAKFLKVILAESFEKFSLSICFILVSLIIIYSARTAYMISCDNYRYRQNTRDRHEVYGTILEAIAVLIFIYVLYLIISAFIILSAGFSTFPA